MAPSRPRVVFLGLDALDVGLFDHLVADGRLPNLARFAECSQRVEVTSEGFILHGSIWPTFASGVGVGRHGVHFWTQWLQEEMRHVRNNHPEFHFDPFWANLPDSGRRVTVVDIPYVPAIRQQGIRHFVGWGLHDEVEPYAWPHGFGRDITRSSGRHPLGFDTVEPQTVREKLVMAREMRRGVNQRARMVIGLLREGADDLVMTTFSEFHKAGHYLAEAQHLSDRDTNIDAQAAILEPLDRRLPELLEAAGPDSHVLIAALHGMQQQVPYDEFGAQLADIANGREPVDPATNPDLLRRIRDAIPDSLHRAIWHRLPAGVRASRQAHLVARSAEFAHDGLINVAYDQHPGFRINLAGRERDGILHAGQGEAVLRKLWDLAASLRSEDGTPAYLELWRPPDHEQGPRVHRLPDALLIANPSVKRASRLATPGGPVLESARPEARNGVHTGHGFALFRPAAGAKFARAHATTVDFAPTILELLGAPQLPDLEGSSLLR